MYLIEKEAKAKWCPMCFNRLPKEVNDDRNDNCEASECMAWRWKTEDGKHMTNGDTEKLGYCGLAGHPK